MDIFLIVIALGFFALSLILFLWAYYAINIQRRIHQRS